MDRLFELESEEMMEELASVEEEMIEDSYVGKENELIEEGTVGNAQEYIEEVFKYMKRCYKPEECTIPSLMKELYRIASTGEYSFLQDIDELQYKNPVFEKMAGESGFEEVLYAIRLLRYYYLVYEKKIYPYHFWKEVEKLYKNTKALGPLEKREKKDRNWQRKTYLIYYAWISM